MNQIALTPPNDFLYHPVHQIAVFDSHHVAVRIGFSDDVHVAVPKDLVVNGNISRAPVIMIEDLNSGQANILEERRPGVGLSISIGIRGPGGEINLLYSIYIE